MVKIMTDYDTLLWRSKIDIIKEIIEEMKEHTLYEKEWVKESIQRTEIELTRLY